MLTHFVNADTANTSTEKSKRDCKLHPFKRIYETGVEKVVSHEYDEEFIGRVPYAIIIDRGDAELDPVQKALWNLLAEQQIRDHGQSITSRYTALYLY